MGYDVMYLNKKGKRFVDVTTAGGFSHPKKGHAVAFADFDNYGDQDIFEQMGGAVPGDKYHDALYENPGFGNHWITIKLVGKQSNRSAIGVRIRVDLLHGNGRQTIFLHVCSGGSFGANPLPQTIGLGKTNQIAQIEVFWPTSNLTQTFNNVKVDQYIKITEGQDSYTIINLNVLQLKASISNSD